MSGHTGAVSGTARQRDSFEPCSGVGVASASVEPGFIPPSPAWPVHSYLELRALPSAPSCLRLTTRHLLREWSLVELGDVTELVVSELVTNAVATTVERCLASPIRWRLSTNFVQVLIEVWDGDPTPPPAPATEPPPPTAVAGRGLLLVGALCTRWGWHSLPTAPGKVVWAEVGP